MINNLEMLRAIIDLKNDDEFYIILVTDVNLYVPIIVTQHTKIGTLITQITRLCKTTGKAYIFLDKKSIRKCSEFLIFRLVKLLNYNKDLSYDLKQVFLDLCNSKETSVEKCRLFVVNSNLPNFQHELFIEVEVDNRILYIGHTHMISKKLKKYLRTYHEYRDNVKMLIYSKK